MRRKHPARKQPVDPLSTEELQAPRKGIDRATFIRVLRQLKTDVSPGLGCLRNEHLLALLLSPERQVTPSAAAVIDEYLDYANAIVKVQMPPYFFKAFVASRLVPVNKTSPDDLPPGVQPDARPLNIGGTERRAITRAYFDEDLQATYNDIVGPVQNGVGLKNGISVTAIGIQAAMDANPDFGVIQGDIKNGYNEISRKSVLDAIRGSGQLDDTLVFSQALLEVDAYVGMGSGTSLHTTPFTMNEGMHQGAIESSWFFSLG